MLRVGHFARECPEGDGGRDVGRGGYGGGTSRRSTSSSNGNIGMRAKILMCSSQIENVLIQGAGYKNLGWSCNYMLLSFCLCWEKFKYGWRHNLSPCTLQWLVNCTSYKFCIRWHFWQFNEKVAAIWDEVAAVDMEVCVMHQNWVSVALHALFFTVPI